jgi:hypothetical protein
MLKLIAIITLCFILISCSRKTRSNCGNSPRYDQLDSLLSIKDANNENWLFYNPDFQGKFRRLICEKLGQFKSIIIFEIQPLFSRERKGIIYKVDNGSFYTFNQRDYGRKLQFSHGTGGNKALELLALVVKNNSLKSTDSLRNQYQELAIKDGSLLRITMFSEVSAEEPISSIIIPYAPDIILNKRYRSLKTEYSH